MAAPIGGLSNAKWRDDKAIIEINAEQADKRLANVLAEQEKKNKQSNDPLAYVHSGVENRMELWDRRNLGKLFRKARGTYQTTPVHMGRIPDRSPMHSGRCHQNTRRRSTNAPTTSTRTTTIPYNIRSSRRGY